MVSLFIIIAIFIINYDYTWFLIDIVCIVVDAQAAAEMDVGLMQAGTLKSTTMMQARDDQAR